MERNVALYPVYQVARNATFWLPVFFLYLSGTCSVAEVFVLEAIYYAGVVVLEVPSGYLSDRLGRRPTLIVAGIATTAAHVVFAATGSFAAFAAAQLLLAAGMAFNSGTDSALLYDSLHAVGKADAFGEVEGRAQAWGLLSMAAASALGGLGAGFDLRWAYVLSALAAAVGLAVSVAFAEPEGHHGRARLPVDQLRAVFGGLRDRRLAWLFAFSVAMTVFNHVPYELVQPYLRLVLGTTAVAGVDAVPLAAGLVGSVGLVVSAYASRRSAAWGLRFGMARLWLGMLAMQAAIIAAIGVAVHPLVAASFLFRGIPGAVMRPTVGATIHPLLDSGLRATYLSVQSLAGRLAFSLALLGTARLVGDLSSLDAAGLGRLGTTFAIAAAAVWAVLWAARRALEPREA